MNLNYNTYGAINNGNDQLSQMNAIEQDRISKSVHISNIAPRGFINKDFFQQKNINLAAPANILQQTPHQQ